MDFTLIPVTLHYGDMSWRWTVTNNLTDQRNRSVHQSLSHSKYVSLADKIISWDKNCGKKFKCTRLFFIYKDNSNFLLLLSPTLLSPIDLAISIRLFNPVNVLYLGRMCSSCCNWICVPLVIEFISQLPNTERRFFT